MAEDSEKCTRFMEKCGWPNLCPDCRAEDRKRQPLDLGPDPDPVLREFEDMQDAADANMGWDGDLDNVYD